MTGDLPDAFDVIIVGGGSAGCVLANRLTESGRLRVALIEAGRDYPPGEEPELISDPGVRGLMNPDFFWQGLGYQDDARTGYLMQARVMGGGSSVNGMFAQRGLQRDYDEWRQLGVEGWGWDDVLPYFLKLENDRDFDGPMHGRDGPVEIRRFFVQRWSGFSRALQQAYVRRGAPNKTNIQTETADCVAPLPYNTRPNRRVSAASAYLTRDVRRRANLAILSETHVRRLSLAGRKVAGVELSDGRVLPAPQVVLSAGSIHSPAVLMRSGIGPAADLQEAGIAPVRDLAGVGGNLQTHPMLSVSAHLARAGRQHDRTMRVPAPMVVRYSSGAPGCPPTDMMLNVFERTPGPLRNDPMGRQLALIMVILNKGYSRGRLRLNPGDPEGPPHIAMNLLKDERDLARMAAGFRMFSEICAEQPVAAMINELFISNVAMGKPLDPMAMKMMADTTEARVLSTVAALAMDFVPGMRAREMGKAGRAVADILADAENLGEFLRSVVDAGGHPAGTCRMGDPDQPGTVVDSRCRVPGIEGLRVIDASIFPTLMTAGTNIPVMMSAEKASDMMLADLAAS